MTAITDAEKLRRRKVMASVLGTSAMEGQFPDQPTLDIWDRYLEGQLTSSGFSQAMDDHAMSLVQTIKSRSLAEVA